MPNLSKAKRWKKAFDKVKTGAKELEEIQEGYQKSLDNWYKTENFADTATAQKVQNMCDIDLSDLLNAIDEIESQADLPEGSGKD